MAGLDVSTLLPRMIDSARGSLKDAWPETKEYAEAEFQKIGESLLYIEQEVLAGRMTQRKAQLHVKMQKNATKMVLLSVEGLGILAAEAAIDAALDVVKETVNTSLGIILL